MVLGRGEGHIMDDCRHVTKDGGIKETRDDHHAQGKSFLSVGVCSDVPESNRGHAGHREVERRQVGGEGGRAPRDHCSVGRGVQRHVEGLVGGRG